MKYNKYLYASMGLLSFLGFIRVFSNAKSFLIFFIFATNFEYLFIKSDEMLEHYINKSASIAFFYGMFTTVSIFIIKNQPAHNAFSYGLAFGFAVSIIIYSISTAYYGFVFGLKNN